MAGAGARARDVRRRAVVARHAVRRAELKRVVADPARSAADTAAAVRALSRLPRDASPTRLRNRDALDGRPRGYLRRFGLSRIRFRDLALRGELPGVRKSAR